MCRPHGEEQNYLFNVGINFIINNSETGKLELPERRGKRKCREITAEKEVRSSEQNGVSLHPTFLGPHIPYTAEIKAGVRVRELVRLSACLYTRGLGLLPSCLTADD